MRKPWRRSRRLLASAMANRFQQMTCKWPNDLFFFRPAVGNFLVNLHSTGKERKIIAQHNSVSVLRLQGTKAAYTTMEWCFAISVTSGKEEKSPRISPQHQPVTTLRPPAADEKTRRRARFQTWFLCQITTSPWRLTFCALWSSKCQITVPSLLVSSLHAFIYRTMFIYLERRAQLMPFLHLFVVCFILFSLYP